MGTLKCIFATVDATFMDFPQLLFVLKLCMKSFVYISQPMGKYYLKLSNW